MGGYDSARPCLLFPGSLQQPLTTILARLLQEGRWKAASGYSEGLRATIFCSFSVEHPSPADMMALHHAFGFLGMLALIILVTLSPPHYYSPSHHLASFTHFADNSWDVPADFSFALHAHQRVTSVSIGPCLSHSLPCPLCSARSLTGDKWAVEAE